MFLFCVAGVFYLNRNYVQKAAFKEVQDHLEKVKEGYVSKEKLGDVLSPISEQLKTIGGELRDIKISLQGEKR